MKKADVERSHHQGHNGDPVINVKHHLWMPDLIRRFRDDGHKFSGDSGFWAWVDEIADDYDTLDRADELARDACWDDVTEFAHQIWPQHSTEMVDEKRWFPEFPPGCRLRFTGEKVPRKKYHVNVHSAGRSGGWCVVSGLPDIESWDAIALGEWRRFDKFVRSIAHDDYPYRFIWDLHVNVYEPDVVEPARRAAERGAEQDAETWAQITRSTQPMEVST